MREEEIPDLNLFMMCERVNEDAFTSLPAGYSIRNCRPDELQIWKAFPFDTSNLPEEHSTFMTSYFSKVYSRDTARFYANTLFACDENDQPVATCASWKAYDAFHSIHWLKTLKSHEGKGIGRALFTVIMQRFAPADFPVYLHTQPGSFRAIGLYADFGFQLLRGEKYGTRINHLNESLPYLRHFMKPASFSGLKFTDAPADFECALQKELFCEF